MDRKDKHEPIAEAITLFAAVVMALGLIAAGFYMRQAGIANSGWLFALGIIVILFGVLGRIF